MTVDCERCGTWSRTGIHHCEPSPHTLTLERRVAELGAERDAYAEVAQRWLKVLESESLFGFIRSSDLQLLKPQPGDIAAAGSANDFGGAFTYAPDTPGQP